MSSRRRIRRSYRQTREKDVEISGRLLWIGGGAGKLQFLVGQSREHRGQFDAKHGATLLAVVTVNFAAVFLHNAETDAQAQAGSFSNGFGGVKGIEHTMRLLDTRAVVREERDDIRAVAHGLDGERAALGSLQGIDRIADDVEKYLHQLIAVAANPRKNGFQLKLDLCCSRAQIEGTKLHSVGDHGVDVQQSALGGDLAGKTQQVAD